MVEGMADRIFVDQQASTEAPFVALVDIMPAGSGNTIVTYYESIYNVSNFGIHPNGYLYWSDSPVPPLDAARMGAANGKFYLEYVIPRNPVAVNPSAINTALTQTARTIVVQQVSTAAGAGFTILAATVAKGTAGSGVNVAASSGAAVIAATTATSTVNAASAEVASTAHRATAASTANLGLTQAVSVLVATTVPSTANAALTATVVTSYATTAATTANAAVTQLAATSRATTTSSSVNASLTTASQFHSNTPTNVNAALSASATSVSSTTYTETFTAADGSTWPSRWTITSGTASIVGNQGKLVSIASSYAAGRADYTYMPATTGDSWVLAYFTQTVGGVEQTANLGLNCDPTDASIYGSSANEIYVRLNYSTSSDPAGAWLNLYQGQTKIGSNVPKTLTPGVAYGVRLQRLSGVIYARVWDSTGAEPSAWDFQVNLASLPQPAVTGVASIAMESGNDGVARTLIVDNVTVNYY